MRDFELRLPHVRDHEDDDSHDGRRLTIRAPDRNYVPMLLQRDGLAGYEPETMACFLATAETIDDPVLDIGANIGVFSLVARAVLDAEVVAFEPTPELAELMSAIAGANGLSIRIEELALGAREGTATFYLSTVTDSSNSLRLGFRPSDSSIEVRTESLDGYLRRTGLTPRLLKIDTEATEPDVLRGGMSYIREHRPWIICEVLAQRSEAKLEALLAPLGYSWYQITSELPLRPRRELFGDRSYRFNNWLFTPEPPTEGYWERVETWKASLATCTPISVPTEEQVAAATAARSVTPNDGTPAPATPSAVSHPPPTAPSPHPRTVVGNPTPPPAVKARRRGVYGRKRLLAGIVGGLFAGFVLGRVRWSASPPA